MIKRQPGGSRIPYAFRLSLRGIPRAYWSLSSIEFMFWFASAASAYMTVFLQKAGYTPAQVGFINALNSVIAICATPFWGMMADKFSSIRKIFIFCVIMASITWALIPVSSKIIFGPIALIEIIIPLGAAFRMPASSLIDAFVVQSAARERLQYGQIRFWGSFSFAVMNMALGAVLPQIGVDASFYVYGAAFTPLMYIMWNMKNTDETGIGAVKKNASSGQLNMGRLFKNYYYVTYLIFAIFLFMPANTSGAFLPYLIDSVGGNTARFGMVAGYKALLEVPALLLMKPITRKFP
ncbi:MAG: MFS transporter, partial [Clostridiales bacterium]|nr:MFS transporter [Clostridiales bacterium]